MLITTFTDHAAGTAEEHDLSLDGLKALIASTAAPVKDALPWLKLARFGTTRTAKGSLRHGANVRAITGIECDYDGKEVDIVDGAMALRRAGIRALVFSSPSYTPAAPKWRVLCPTSRELPPDMRADLVAKVNGVLGGILAKESFTLAQAYFYGWTPATIKPAAMVIPGEPVDLVPGLPAVYPPAGLVAAPVILPAQGTATEAEHVQHVLTAALDVFGRIGEPGLPADRHAALLSVSLALAPFILSGHLDREEAQDAARAACEASGRTPNDGEVESVFAGALSRANPWRPPSGGAEFMDDLALGFEKHTVRIEPGNLTEQVDAAERALIGAAAGIYQRGGLLVRLVRREDGTLRQQEVDEAHLHELVSRVTKWVRFDVRAGADVDAKAPRDIARTYLARGAAEWRVPELAGVVRTATLRSDGSVLTAPGYDPATCLFLAVADCPAGVPENPTREDAEEAARVLDGLLSEFPFVAEADKAVAVAAVLTAIIRRSLPTAPLFAFTAPTPGTGKSLLVDLVSLIATGRDARAFTWSDDEAENRKQLDAALLEGTPAINLDNVRAALGGDRLNQVLTQTAATVRVLGQSKNIEVPCGAFFTANGNNLVIEADLTRRTMLCRMDARVERPELRAFKVADPKGEVEADRARYVTAALTMLRAHHVAGRPCHLKPIGSFSAWSGWVRAAVVWLGYADPVASQEAVREVDPRSAELAAVLGQWNEWIGDRAVTSSELIDTAAPRAEFREALLAVAGQAGAINTKRLGMWIKANSDRITAGRSIVAGGKNRTGSALWTLAGGRRAVEVREFPRAATLLD